MTEVIEEYLSTTSLARLLQINRDKLFEQLISNGWLVNKGTLSDKGILNGAKYESNDKGEKWPVWSADIIDNVTFKNEIIGNVSLIKRKFNLPGFDDLNKDQDRVLRLPEDGQFLVIGGPGTGKSVVALLRTMKYHDNKDYVFLTYNKVLLSATKQLVEFDINSFTLDSWFGKVYWKIFNEFVPTINEGDRKLDYQKVIKNLEEKNLEEKSYHIIIDEGQDKSKGFYESLLCLGLENFFIVADQNQQITEDNSSRQDLTDLLGLEAKDVIKLKENFRNSYPIAKFCSHFYTDISSPAPQLPSSSRPSLGIPILYEYINYKQCINTILREYDKDNRSLIGVVVANDDLRDTYVKALESIDINLDNSKPIISTYSSKDKSVPNINFAYSGIVVLNDKSIKGLEFDIVYIVIDGFETYNNDIDVMKKRFYVMSSRAVKKLVLLKSKQYNGTIDQILPDDENILVKMEL